MRLAAALAFTIFATVAVAVGAPASASPGGVAPYVHGDQTVPTYSYADAVHESVYVQLPIDSDGDGVLDRVALDLIRPATPAGVHVPVIMDASPYYQCCGRGNEYETKTYDDNGVIAKMPLYYDNYFVPRGYAMAQLDLPGTSRSTGCDDLGGPDEVLAAKTAIKWLDGRATAFDAAGDPVSATAWSNGKVGMIGKSWDGSIANGTAATGVSGLRTVVDLSGISSWYDYMRFGGVVRSPDFTSGLEQTVSDSSRCDSSFTADQKASDDGTGDLNAFWNARDYRPDARHVKASVFVVHGLNDQNVTTNQFGDWWKKLAAAGVARKIWLSQDGHVDPFDYRRSVWVKTLHQWFDYWLQGIDNGIMQQPQASVQQAAGTWVDEPTWPTATGTSSYRLSTLGGAADRTIVDHPSLSEDDAVDDPAKTVAGRETFLTGSLAAEVHVSGTPSVTLRMKVDKPTTEITARLVDYGNQKRVDYQSQGEGITTLSTQSCWGESTKVDDACYYDTQQDYVTSNVDVITRGWLDAAHHESLHRTTPLTPGTWYSITVPLDTTDATFAAGHSLGLVVSLSDTQDTSPATTGATVVIDPSHSTLDLPVDAG